MSAPSEPLVARVPRQVWDAKTTDCLFTFRPPQPNAGTELPVHVVRQVPLAEDQMIVCNRSPNLYIVTLQGQIIRSFSSGPRPRRCPSPTHAHARVHAHPASVAAATVSSALGHVSLFSPPTLALALREQPP